MVISVQLIDSPELLEAVSHEWNRLLEHSQAKTLFLRWEWVYSWAITYIGKGRELSVLIVREGEEAIGIAPWYLEDETQGFFSIRCLKFLGAPECGSDYLDVICEEGKEKVVAGEVCRFIFHECEKKWDTLFFKDVSANSPFFLHFMEEFEEKGKYVEVSSGAFCPLARLPGKKEEFAASLSRNRRQQYGRHRRVLEKRGKVEHCTHRDFSDLSIFEEFYMLYEKRWEKQDERFKDFLQRLVESAPYPGFVQIDLLRVNGKAVAGIFHLNFEKTRYYYLMAVDRSYDGNISIGNILIGQSIERAIDEGCRDYDFLKGVEPYKFSWARGGNRLLNYRVYKKNIPSFLYFMRESSKRIGKILFR